MDGTDADGSGAATPIDDAEVGDGAADEDEPDDPDDPHSTDDPDDPDGPHGTDDPDDSDDSDDSDDPDDPDDPTLGRRLRDASPAGRRLFTILSRSGALEILSEVGEREPVRFSELQRALGLSSATLSARLGELADAGLVTRTSYDEIPPRVEYAGTERLGDLKPVFGHLVAWAERHGFDADGTDDGADDDQNT